MSLKFFRKLLLPQFQRSRYKSTEGHGPQSNSTYSLSRRLRLEQLEHRRLLAITVNTLVDELDGSIVDGDISLRDAIAAATSDETIDFSVTGIINLDLALGELLIDKPLQIVGPGADQLTINAGNGLDTLFNTADGIRIFNIDSAPTNFTATVSGVTLMGGDVSGNGGAIRSTEGLILDGVSVEGNSATQEGGGIYFGSPGLGVNFEMIASTVHGNFAGVNGGGIRLDLSSAFGVVTNSTLSGNSANDQGGGVWNNGEITFRHSTITDNTSDADNSGTGSGGGIRNNFGNLTLDHTILAENSDNAAIAPDISGNGSGAFSIIGDNTGSGFAESQSPDGTGNLIGGPTGGAIDPLFGALQNNGGATLTHSLLEASPALNAGDSSVVAGIGTVPLYDQRGDSFNRIIGGDIDIGAFEQQTIGPANLVVDTTSDIENGIFGPGDLSLREAINLANTRPGADIITFDANLSDQTIAIESSLPILSDDLVIAGLGAARLTISAEHGTDSTPGTGDGWRIFHNISFATIRDIRLSGGDISGDGGAILNGGDLTIIDSMITDNAASLSGGGIANLQSSLFVTGSLLARNTSTAGNGAGIHNSSGGFVNVSNSTLSHNTAPSGNGGAIYDASLGSLSVRNSTLTRNSANNGGGIYTSPVGGASLDNSIVSDNHAVSSSDDLWGPFDGYFSLLGADGIFIGGANNTISDTPLLGPLANNGGPTQTHAPLPGSPALNAGNPSIVSPPTTDQRGAPFQRIVGAAIDIGAYEAQTAPSADFVDDDVINGADFLAWQRGFGISMGALRADGNSDDDGDVDASDLAAWAATFGQVETTPFSTTIFQDEGFVMRFSGRTTTTDLIDAALAVEWLSSTVNEEELVPLEMATLVEEVFTVHKELDKQAAEAITGPKIKPPHVIAADAKNPSEPWLSEEVLSAVLGEFN